MFASHECMAADRLADGLMVTCVDVADWGRPTKSRDPVIHFTKLDGLILRMRNSQAGGKTFWSMAMLTLQVAKALEPPVQSSLRLVVRDKQPHRMQWKAENAP